MYVNYQMQSGKMLAQVKDIICGSLLEEVQTTPKPGLVDLWDTGAHLDMDCQTFEKSAKAITPYLTQMFGIGYYGYSNDKKESCERLFLEIRKVGKRAEQAMFQATGGVNTHKGIIFTMGILAAASGLSMKVNGQMDMEKVFLYVQRMTERILEQEIEDIEKRKPVTHGEILFAASGERGIRGEAQKGFPIITRTAYPVLKALRECGYDENNCNIQMLLEVIGVLNDTNVLSRGGKEQLVWIKQTAQNILQQGGAFSVTGQLELREFNQECIRRNLSPGGAADILAATLYLYYMEKMFGEI